MAAGGRDVKMRDADATDRITKRKSDALAEFYSSAAADGSKDAKEREASMLFSVAEAHIDEDEDYEAALKTAEEALDLFRQIRNARGSADTLRLIVHTHIGKSEEYRWSERGDPKSNLTGVTEKLAEKTATEELAKFRESGDTRGAACMLLSLAEISWFRGNRQKREISFEWASEAHEIFQHVGDKKFEAIAKQALVCINLQRHNNEDALKLSEEAQMILHDLGETKEEARTLHMLACAQVADNQFGLGIATANQALLMFREMGLKKFAGFELYCIAHWMIHLDRGRDALPLAKEAQAIFQDLGLNKGWQAGGAQIVLDAHLNKGDKSQALKVAKEELERFQESGDKRAEICARIGLVKAHMVRESPVEAMQEVEHCLEICRDDLQDRRWEACMLVNACYLHKENHTWDQAASAGLEAQSLFQELDDKGEEARALRGLHDLHNAKSDFRMALQVATEMRSLLQEEDDRLAEASAVNDMAAATCNEGRPQPAMALATEAQGMFQELGSKNGEGCAWQLIAQIHLNNETQDLALQAAEKMQALFEECDDPKQQARGLKTMSFVHTTREEFEKAVAVANKARQLAKKSENRMFEVEILICVTNANVALLNKKIKESNASGKDLGRAIFDKAMKPAKEAVLLAKKTGNSHVTGSAVYTLGQMLLVQGKVGDSLKAADDAGSLFKMAGDDSAEVSCVLLSAEAQFYTEDYTACGETTNRAMTMAKSINDKLNEQRGQEIMQRIKAAQSGGGKAAPAQAVEAGAPVAEAAVASAAPVKKGLDEAIVSAMVKSTLMQSIGADEDVSMDVPLMEAGMDSLSMVAFRNSLQKESGISMPASTMFDYPTMRGLTDHLVEESQNK